MTFTDRKKNDGGTGHSATAEQAKRVAPVSPSPNDGKGQGSYARKRANGVPPSPSPKAAKGQPKVAAKAKAQVSAAAPNAETGHRRRAVKARGLLPVSAPNDRKGGAIPTFPSLIAALGHRTGADKATHQLPDAAPNDGLSQSIIAERPTVARPTRQPKAAKGHNAGADKAIELLPSAAPHAETGLSVPADAAMLREPVSALIDGSGQARYAERPVKDRLTRQPKAAKGQLTLAAKAKAHAPSAAPHAETGHTAVAEKAMFAVPVSALIDKLAELQVRRKFWISSVNKHTNAVKALVRRALGWRYDEEETGREKVNARAAHIVSAALNGKEQKPEDMVVFDALAADLAVVSQSIAPCQAARHQIELEMKRLVRQLPVYPWAKAVRGLGELGLAVIVAEAGDLSKYPKKGHLWKRLGLAPVDGQAYSTWRANQKGLSKEEKRIFWTEAGYSPRRRAEIYAVVQEPMMKQQLLSKEKSGTQHGEPIGPYGAVYVRRRERLDIVHPDWTPKHCQMDAMRVMAKYLIRDLWVVWRQAKAPVPGQQARISMPAAEALGATLPDQVSV